MATPEKTIASFGDFTNLYELSKTLRFELRPVGKTEDFLKEREVFGKDEEVARKYEAIKPLFDGLHRKFVAEALRPERIDAGALRDLAAAYEAYKSDPDRRGKKAVEKLGAVKERLWKNLAEAFVETAEEWRKRYPDCKLKSPGAEILTDEGILDVLAGEYPEQQALFASFQGFFTYFGGFNETRENFYKTDGTATAVVTRVVDNLMTFLDNAEVFAASYADKAEALGLSEGTEAKFVVDSYPECALQKGIERYNKLVGELNKDMKEMRDKAQSKLGKDFKKSDFPLLRTLHNQILGERDKAVPFKVIESEAEAKAYLYEAIALTKDRYAVLRRMVGDLAAGKFRDSLSGIYLNNRAVNTISRRWLKAGEDFERQLPQKGAKSKEETVRVADVVSFADIAVALEAMTSGDDKAELFRERYFEGDKEAKPPVPPLVVMPAGATQIEKFIAVLGHELEQLFTNREYDDSQGQRVVVKGYDETVTDLEAALADIGGTKDIAAKEKAKAYLDAALGVFQMGKYFSWEVGKKWERPTAVEAEFYNLYEDAYAKDFFFPKYYDAFRNYFSRKPGDDENKVKLNFGKGNLLSGWQESPEGNAQFHGYILRRASNYYLGITTNPRYLDRKMHGLDAVDLDVAYEKLEPFQLSWGKNIVGGQVYGSFTKSRTGVKTSYKEDQARMSPREHVELIKDLIREKYLGRYPDLQPLIDGDYESPKEMQKHYDEIEVVGMTFKPIDSAWVDRQEFEVKGKRHLLYLFEIHNKDMNLAAKGGGVKIGKKNTHTMYWDSLFSVENLEKLRFKLGANAEVFRRPNKKEELNQAANKDGDKLWNDDGSPVLEHRRYSEDKLFLHLPILINRGAYKAFAGTHNKMVRRYLSQRRGQRVIGIDRGEKHLLYYSVVDENGNILEQGSLNTIGGIDYQAKLVECERQRREDRKNWEPARRIKDLKKGYVSHAVHAVCELIRKHEAIVVLEDLNMRFKEIRGGIERSVYQQFERALISKLGYLVFKDKRPSEPGGVMRGYQLTAPFESFEKLGKQSGFLFYTQAEYTSVTDPVTGFRKNAYIRATKREDIRKVFTEKVRIGWDDERQSFWFAYDAADFSEQTGKRGAKAKVVPDGREWKLYADVPRIKRFKSGGRWKYGYANPNAMLKELFAVWKLEGMEADAADFLAGAAADEQLSGEREFDGRKRDFWSSLAYIFGLIQQLRNSRPAEYSGEGTTRRLVTPEADFIASPVAPFFCTAAEVDGRSVPANMAGLEKRIVGADQDRIMAEFNGDANGAYNIARKGLLLLEKNRLNPDKPDLYIGKEDWDAFVQKFNE
jgi:hypothetical protein